MPYKTPDQAYAVARNIGCTSIHRMPDGSYMPCATHAEYERTKKDGVDKKSNAVPLAVENALRRKMRSHNNRYGENKETRTTLGSLKGVYRSALQTYKPNKKQNADNWAMSRVNSHLNKLASVFKGAEVADKMNNIFKVRDACSGQYPVVVVSDFQDSSEIGSWSELVFLAKSAEAALHIYKEENLVCVFNKSQNPVLTINSKKEHSLFPGKKKYGLCDKSGNVVESGWTDSDFEISDNVTIETPRAETTSVEILTLTEEQEAVDSLQESVSDDITTEEFLGTIVDNKIEKSASIVFLSLMPTLDEKNYGRALCGSIEKNLVEQIIDPISASVMQSSFVNIVPVEVLNEDGKRSAPSAEMVEEWQPVVLSAIEKADPNRIVIALGKDVAEHYADVVDFVMPHPFSKSKYSLPRKVEELKKAYENKFDRQVKITKSDADRRLVYGVVLEPEVIDAHNDIVSIDEIENAAHNYLIKSRMIGDQHNKPAKADIVESYIAPADLDIGGQQIKKGSWVMVTKVHDDRMWTGIKKGSYTGYSIGGYAVKEPLEDVGRLAQ